MSTRFFGPPLRAAAAEAREVLVQLAAERLKVPAGGTGGEGRGDRPEEGRRPAVSFADLTKGKRIERQVNQKAGAQDGRRFHPGRQAGDPDGRPRQGDRQGEIRRRHPLPGMLYAKILRPPAHGASSRASTPPRPRSIPGVRVVRQGDLVAVLHEHPDVAEDGAAKGQRPVRRAHGHRRRHRRSSTICSRSPPRGRIVAKRRRPGPGREARREVGRIDVSERLRGPRPDGAPRRLGQVRRRQGHRLGVHAEPLRAQGRGGPGAWPSGRKTSA